MSAGADSIGAVTDDWHDFTDPLNPAGIGWGEWLCPDCGEDGGPADLVDGRCPNFGGGIE
jgi:hypothetical protein